MAERPKKRLILTFATGHPRYVAMAKALAMSLELQGSTVPRAIVTDSDDPELRRLYTHVSPPPKGYDYWFIKLCALDVFDADQVMYLDGDSLAVRAPDGYFDLLEGSDFAVQGAWVSKVGNWYGDMDALMARRGVAAVPKFSGGFLYYERTEAAQALIGDILALRDAYDELGLQRNRGQVVDEVCISLAMAESKRGRVVPDRLDISTTPWQRVGPLTLDVLRGECAFVKGYEDTRIRRPAIYHSALAGIDVAYWREVRRLFDVYRRRDRLRETGGDDATRNGAIRKRIVKLMESFTIKG